MSRPTIDPSVNPANIPEQASIGTVRENPNPGGCKKHCHYPTAPAIRGGGRTTQWCVCMEKHRQCDFEWESDGRGFCRNCHHASSLTVKAADRSLHF